MILPVLLLFSSISIFSCCLALISPLFSYLNQIWIAKKCEILLQYLLFVTPYRLQIVLCSNSRIISFQSAGKDNSFGTHAILAFAFYHFSRIFFSVLSLSRTLKSTKKLHLELKQTGNASRSEHDECSKLKAALYAFMVATLQA